MEGANWPFFNGTLTLLRPFIRLRVVLTFPILIWFLKVNFIFTDKPQKSRNIINVYLDCYTHFSVHNKATYLRITQLIDGYWILLHIHIKYIPKMRTYTCPIRWTYKWILPLVVLSSVKVFGNHHGLQATNRLNTANVVRPRIN